MTAIEPVVGLFETPCPEPVFRRNFLFLQGPVGGFFSELAGRVQSAGHRVRRINFNGGDRLFWNLADSVDFREGPYQWPAFLSARLIEWKITDILLFGDCRPLHRVAISQAQMHGISVYVFEEGYLRPNWITVERGGVNGHSSLPRDSQWFRKEAASLPLWDGGAVVTSSFLRRSIEDVAYTLGLVFLQWRFPGYKTHRPWHPLVEYRAGARRFFIKGRIRRKARDQVAKILADATPFYLFPLQLDSDAQIRFHSPFKRMTTAIDYVVESFAQSAPRDALLVLTEHPLDNGVIDLRSAAARAARYVGISDRVIFVANGSPEPLLRGSRGIVTVNSTIGFVALNLGVPVVTLGESIYDLPDLCFQGGLDAFWHNATPADPDCFDAFRRVVAARTQVNGGLFSRAARDLALDGVCARLSLAGAVSHQYLSHSTLPEVDLPVGLAIDQPA